MFFIFKATKVITTKQITIAAIAPPGSPELFFLNTNLPVLKLSICSSSLVPFILVFKLRLISHANCSGLMKLSMKNISFPSESWTACLSMKT